MIFYFFRTGQGNVRLTALFPVVPAARRVDRLWNIFRHREDLLPSVDIGHRLMRRFIVVQSILVPMIVGLLLHLLSLMAGYRRFVQILHDILQIFIDVAFILSHDLTFLRFSYA